MEKLFVFMGSENDRVFLQDGLKYLSSAGIEPEIIVASVHRGPETATEKIKKALYSNPMVLIAGAATATGLPGVIAGYAKEKRTIVIGIRFSKQPTTVILEDASFGLSSMPKNVPLLYAGCNEKGFLHACMLAEKILKSA